MALQLQLLKPGSTTWRPKHQSTPINTSYNPLTLDIVITRLGWAPRISHHRDARLREIGVVNGESLYYAELGSGALAKYDHTPSGQQFFVTERPVLTAHEPFVFNYPNHVRATAVALAGGTAVIVRPDPSVGRPFAHWTDGGHLITIFFGWPASQAEAEALMQSVAIVS
jgi:hypothetical protein